LKIFPDELIQAADAVQEHDAEKLLGAGELVSVGVAPLAEMQAKERVSHALRRLQSEIAESNAQMLSQHIVDAVLYLTRADYALVLMMDDNGSDLASGYDQPVPDALVEAKRRLVEGIAEWVKHADRTVTVPDISKSAWSRYLTDDAVKTGSIVGVPIPEQRGTSTFGAIVVGFDRARAELEEPLTAMQSFVTEGLYALVIGRKLIQAEQLALLDTQSGAYSQRFLEDLLENEISRASRHNHDLAVVLFEIETYEVLRGKYGEAGLGRILREFVGVSRRPEGAPSQSGVRFVKWDARTAGGDWVNGLAGAQGIINLAGASIGKGRWTRRRMEEILSSRLSATSAIVEAVNRTPADRRPSVLVNASGIDYYGNRGDELVTEESGPGDSFLARVSQQWEAAARQAQPLGVRVALVRTALVFGRGALAFRLLTLPFRVFAGGPLGNGRQWFTWIHIDDLVGLYRLALENPKVSGPMNAVA